jgi:hypothetical protein
VSSDYASVIGAAVQEIMDEAAESVKLHLETAHQAAAVHRLLKQAGLPLKDFGKWDIKYPFFTVERSHLPTVRHALGRLKLDAKYAETSERISVHLKLERFPRVSIRYLADLPAGSKCRVVSTIHTSLSLVCETTPLAKGA